MKTVSDDECRKWIAVKIHKMSYSRLPALIDFNRLEIKYREIFIYEQVDISTKPKWNMTKYKYNAYRLKGEKVQSRENNTEYPILQRTNVATLPIAAIWVYIFYYITVFW